MEVVMQKWNKQVDDSDQSKRSRGVKSPLLVLSVFVSGGTRDIGSALTRMCMRHRSIETKLRQFSMVFLDCFQGDHAKEYKKARQEIKKRSSDTLKLQKKAKKGRGDLQPQLDSAMQEVSDKYLLLEETEKQAVRRALVEERSRFCCFVSMLRPVVEEEMSMLGEITHLQTLTDDLKTLTMDPHKLPASSEQVIVDLKGSECTWSYQTPPSSPSTTVSRKSSMCSSLNSVNSSDSRSSGSHCHSPTSHFRYRASSSSSSVLPQQTPARLSSISSHDSGFISQDAFQSKSPSPMPPETSQLFNGYDHPAALCLHGVVLQAQDTHLHPPPYFTSSSSSSSSPISSPSYSSMSPTWPWCRSGSGQSGESLALGLVPSSRVLSWKDWAKPGPYEQGMVNTLKRSKDRRETSDPAATKALMLPQHLERNHQGLKEAHEELARVLARGLRLDIHGSSRDSLQGSSGYSSQTNTPCCSEDAIPSQADQDVEQQQSSDFDKSSTIPRNSDITQSYRRMFQSKRPASTAGLPSHPSAIITPGVATIRRTPSSKPNLRRPSGGLSLGPIPIKPPMIPVKTPTVPEHPGFPAGPHQRTEAHHEHHSVEDYLVAIRRGVRLKKATTNDRSAPIIQ
uniref:MTSS I-BAR domain containing 1 n=1 Tax=Labrus bergylta TaxID=56723 RepID=A0A3Q3GI59_9LABR